MVQSSHPLRAILVTRNDAGDISRSLTSVTADQLPAGEVTIAVSWSSLNYKDALAASGHPGVARHFPHVPGIDAAGVVVAAPASSHVRVGEAVLVTGYELGAGQWGGWCEQIRVPADWVVPLPSGLSQRESMVLGTAGFTAAQCVRALQRHEVSPANGPIVVTGATGGVGSFAVQLLAQLGYHVIASTGKRDAHDWLTSLGATEFLARDELAEVSQRPLLTGRFAGGVDTVGGNTLATLLKSTQPFGCVAACGLVGGDDLPLSVYPFILRGVALDGISSSLCSASLRREVWEQLSGAWKPRHMTDVQEVTLNELEPAIATILAGQVRGRIVVRVGPETSG